MIELGHIEIKIYVNNPLNRSEHNETKLEKRW